MAISEKQKTNLELFFFMDQLQTITRLPILGYSTIPARLDLSLLPGNGQWSPTVQTIDPTDFVLGVPLLWWGSGAGDATIADSTDLTTFKAAANLLYAHYRPEDNPIQWTNAHNDWALLSPSEASEFVRLLPEVFVILWSREKPPTEHKGLVEPWGGFLTDGPDDWVREAINAYGRRIAVDFAL